MGSIDNTARAINMRQRLSVLVASPANLALMPMMAIGSLADDPRGIDLDSHCRFAQIPWYLSHGTKAYPFNLVVDI
jgi:hypothetical protein